MSNADLGLWLGANSETICAFGSEFRPVPLHVQVDSLSILLACPLHLISLNFTRFLDFLGERLQKNKKIQ